MKSDNVSVGKKVGVNRWVEKIPCFKLIGIVVSPFHNLKCMFIVVAIAIKVL